jgi:hypothetical protein
MSKDLGTGKDVEKMANRLDDFVTTLNQLMKKIETEFHEVTHQSRVMQKEMNRLHESVSQFQKDLSTLSKGQESIQQTLERCLTGGRVKPLGAAPAIQGPSHSDADTAQPGTGPVGTAIPASADATKLKMSEYLKQKQSVFDTRVLNAFINATRETAKMLLMKNANFLRPQPLPPGKFVTFANAARMKLSKGKDSGFMGVGFKAKHLQPTVATLFGISEPEVTGAMINDLVKEFCNQVFGQAKAALLKDGIEFTISYPEVALGSQLEIRKNWGDSYLVLVFEIEEKEFYIMFW